MPQDTLPSGAVLDLVYSHQSLVTSTGHNGQPSSSSSAPTLMARMLEALDLRRGLRVLEIGAASGYNAALIATITGAEVTTVEAGADTARGAVESIRRLGLDHRVTVCHGDGYLGGSCGGPYDRIIVTCGVAGLSPHWLGQLAPGGRIVAPIAHGGVHPVLVNTVTPPTVRGTAALWADFMPAAGPLRPKALVGHDPAEDIAATAVTRIPDASPARTMAAYQDLWFFLATRHLNITRAYTDDGTVDPTQGACALHLPSRGTAWVQTDGSIAVVGESTVAEELRALTRAWDALGQPSLTQFTCTFDQSGSADTALWVPHQWALDAVTARD
ncbi:MAG: protein-L-isoaspartate O-methyltransferase family protein [Pseudonocardiaceae bacterium]